MTNCCMKITFVQGELIYTAENADLCVMYKSKGGRFSFEEIDKAIDTAIDRGREIREFCFCLRKPLHS